MANIIKIEEGFLEIQMKQFPDFLYLIKNILQHWKRIDTITIKFKK